MQNSNNKHKHNKIKIFCTAYGNNYRICKIINGQLAASFTLNTPSGTQIRAYLDKLNIPFLDYKTNKF